MVQKVAVKNNKQMQRFEATLGEGVTAFIQYKESGTGTLTLTHTEVPEEFEGKGIGSALVKGTLEIIKTEGFKVAPECQFVRLFLQRHPMYQSLVAE